MYFKELNTHENLQSKKIAIIGGGIVGTTTAWSLASLGYQVVLIDKELNERLDLSQNLSGTKASLGILMGNTFRRSSGRSWRLRQRSMELWPDLIQKLSTKENPLKINRPLIQLARSTKEYEFMLALASKRKDLGVTTIKNFSSKNMSRSWPQSQYGGLISRNDGRIDPTALMKGLIIALQQLRVELIKAKVSCLERKYKKGKYWLIHLENDNHLQTDAVIICSANGSESLIKKLGYNRPIAAVLGQVITLRINDQKSWDKWPAVLSSNGVNLIPDNHNKLLLGATVEPGTAANALELINMMSMDGNSPKWMEEALINSQWKGLRARPQDRPAPLLEKLEEGLILNTAHYKNGFLLAPACAEWVGKNLCENTISSQ